jgi:hypothetical protein
MARAAAQARDRPRLELLERGIGLLRRGLTAGERVMAARWAGLDEAALWRELGRLPIAAPRSGMTGVEMIGVLALERRPKGR